MSSCHLTLTQIGLILQLHFQTDQNRPQCVQGYLLRVMFASSEKEIITLEDTRKEKNKYSQCQASDQCQERPFL